MICNIIPRGKLYVGIKRVGSMFQRFQIESSVLCIEAVVCSHN